MEKKQIALLGCGRISNRHIEAVEATDGIEFSVVCDTIPDRADEKAGKTGARSCYDMKDIGTVDAVSVCTPSGAHPRDVMRAADLVDTKYIICEKPVSLTVREAIEMYKYVEKKGKVLLPVFQNRYNPLVAFTKELIDSGKLGRVFQFNCNVLWNRNDEYFQIDWHGTRDLDGGVLYTQASHYVDMVHYFFGEVAETLGLGGNLRGLEVQDTVSAALRFENGVVGTINATVSVYRQNFLTELTVIGEKGTLRLTGTNLNQIDFWDVEGMDKPDMDFTLDHVYGKGHDTLYKYFVEEKWEMFPSYDDVISGIGLMQRLSY